MGNRQVTDEKLIEWLKNIKEEFNRRVPSSVRANIPLLSMEVSFSNVFVICSIFKSTTKVFEYSDKGLNTSNFYKHAKFHSNVVEPPVNQDDQGIIPSAENVSEVEMVTETI